MFLTLLGSRALSLSLIENDAEQGTFFETTFLALTASLGDPKNLAWPGSVREESSPVRAGNYNHDAYVINCPKIALQIKSRRGADRHSRYQSEISKVYVRDIIFNSAVAIYGEEAWGPISGSGYINLPTDKKHQLFQLTSELLVADCDKGVLDDQEAEYIALLKTEIAYRIDNARQKGAALRE